MGGSISSVDKYIDYTLKINNAKDNEKLKELENMLIVEFHWSENDSEEDKVYTALLEYVHIKMNYYNRKKNDDENLS